MVHNKNNMMRMKNLIKIIGSLLLLLVLAACTKEIELYDGEEGVYFNVQYGPEWGNERVWANQQLTNVEFINIAGNVDTVLLKVMITGRVKDYDRYFHAEIVGDSTSAIAGENYEQLTDKYTIKAGEHFTYLPVVVHRTKNIRDEAKELLIRLLPSQDFTIGIPVWKKLAIQWEGVVKGEFKADFHKLILSDFISRPKEWIGVSNAGLEAGLWGEFSQKKFLLICEQFDLAHADFMSPTTMPMAKKTVIKEHMVRFLQNLYNQKTPILEEDGRLMWFMGVTWSSRIGVPWKGF